MEVESIEKFLAGRYIINVAPLSTRFISRRFVCRSAGDSVRPFRDEVLLSSLRSGRIAQERFNTSRAPWRSARFSSLAFHVILFNQLASFRFIFICFLNVIIIISCLHPPRSRPFAHRCYLVPFLAARWPSWKRRARARCEKPKKNLSRATCATQRDREKCMHVRTYVRTYVRAARVRVCVPTYGVPPFPAVERLAATSRTYTGARARTRIYVTHARSFVGLGRADGRPGVTDFSRPRRTRATSRVCRNTLADRAAPITGRAIYRRREIRAQGRAFSARGTARP